MKILVTMDWQGEQQRVGELEVFSNRGHDVYQFLYDDQWVASGFQIDPVLALSSNEIFTSKTLPGVFQDISPDRWGRLIQKRARRGYMSDVDYLLGVSDWMRMGAIRLSLADNPEAFVAEHTNIPKLINLRDLEAASRRVEQGQETSGDVQQLLGPGSSLGGARPKAVVQDGDQLYLAKFQSNLDVERIGAWEATMLDLAFLSGIPASVHRLLNKDSERPILLLSRFDRIGSERIPFASAMTLANAQDGDEFSYAALSEVISCYSSQPKHDKFDLWKRMVFNAMTGNTDDHLRNHAFLRMPQGWRLSPAYDLTPNDAPFEQRTHALFFLDDAHPSLEACRELGQEYFDLKESEVQMGFALVGAALATWRDAARMNGLTDNEINRMENAFEHEAKDELVHLAALKGIKAKPFLAQKPRGR